jgi:hypothetical protein
MHNAAKRRLICHLITLAVKEIGGFHGQRSRRQCHRGFKKPDQRAREDSSTSGQHWMGLGALAGFFGIGGGVGATLLGSAREELTQLRDDVKEVRAYFELVRDTLVSQIRDSIKTGGFLVDVINRSAEFKIENQVFSKTSHGNNYGVSTQHVGVGEGWTLVGGGAITSEDARPILSTCPTLDGEKWSAKTVDILRFVNASGKARGSVTTCAIGARVSLHKK